MKNRFVVIISVVLIVVAVGSLVILNRKSDGTKSVSDFIDMENEDNPYDYSSNIPEEIKGSEAWKDFMRSDYYNSEQQLIFQTTDDRIVSELYYDNYYIYLEYVFGELTIDIYNSDTMVRIIRFD